GVLEVRENCFDRTDGRPDLDSHVAWSDARSGNIVTPIELGEGYTELAPAACSLELAGPARWVWRFTDRPSLEKRSYD
ncbi:MAG: hypothetical protein ACQEVA_03990, partial [Myxococcota bacterium]